MGILGSSIAGLSEWVIGQAGQGQSRTETRETSGLGKYKHKDIDGFGLREVKSRHSESQQEQTI